jgi:hypothetical protein
MLKNWPFTHKYPGCLTTHKLRSPQAAMSWLLIIWMLFPIPIYIHLKYQLIFFVANTFRIQPFHRDWHHSSNIIIGTDITAVIYSKLESVPEHFVARWYVRNLMRFWPIFGKKTKKWNRFRIGRHERSAKQISRLLWGGVQTCMSLHSRLKELCI